MKFSKTLLLIACLGMTSACHASHPLVAELETDPAPYPGDSADDAAVWVHPENPERSVILTTVKASNVRPVKPTGIQTFDLNGKQIEFFQDDTPNNIDVRGNFAFANGPGQLIAASHWFSDEFAFYRMEANSRKLIKLTSIPTGIQGLRGLCLGRIGQATYAFGIGSDGEIEQYEIETMESIHLVNRWQLKSEAEGCVVDDASGRLFVAEENFGIWWLDLNQDSPILNLLDKIRWFGPLKRGLEGLSLIHTSHTTYLIASVQEKNRFALYDLSTQDFLGSFSIKGGATIDPVSHTDGIHVEHLATQRFPKGFILVHDDINETNGQPANQNFKIVSLDSLLELINKLEADR